MEITNIQMEVYIIFFLKKDLLPVQPQKEELDSLRNKVKEAYAKLDNTTDPVLIDSCIYEINAASLRYDFYLNLAKNNAQA